MASEHPVTCLHALTHVVVRHGALASAASLTLALIGGCDPIEASGDNTPDDAAITPVAITPRSGELDEKCPARRQIAFIPPALCHETSSWNAKLLFADGSPSLPDTTGVLPTRLHGYCQFTLKATGQPGLPALDELPDGAERDCEVVWGQSDVLTSALRPDLSATHFDHLDAGTVGLGTAPVTVAVIDSLPEADVDGRSDHGETIGALISGVQCPTGAPCTPTVDYRLALPRFGLHGEDWDNGGYYGSQGELAKAIYGAVRTWKDSTTGGHLVLNLSVGWEPRMFDATTPRADLDAPVRAVHDALQYASCQGALVIAAAGNATGDACQSGALAPALWEGVLAPDPTVCSNAFQVVSDPTTARLIYAVGGLRHDGQPLASTRPGGKPRLFAPGFLAVFDGPDPTTPMSGSSLSAASASAVASLVWSRNPGLTPAAVIQRLADSALPLTPPTAANFGVGGTARRISACRAVKNCIGGAACPDCDSLPLDLTDLADASLAAITALDASGDVIDHNGSGVTSVRTCNDVCGAGIKVFTDNVTPCQPLPVAGLTRATSPQPEEPPCPVCLIDTFSAGAGAGGVAYLTLNERYAGRPITNVALELLTPAALATDPPFRERIELGALAMTTTEALAVTLPVAAHIETSTRATLHVTFTTAAGPQTQSNEIPVY